MTSREHDLQAHIAFGRLVKRMADGEPFTTRKIAREFDRDIRTAQRWLADIDAWVFPLDGNKRVKWRKR